jgi:hypothetical protein
MIVKTAMNSSNTIDTDSLGRLSVLALSTVSRWIFVSSLWGCYWRWVYLYTRYYLFYIFYFSQKAILVTSQSMRDVAIIRRFNSRRSDVSWYRWYYLRVLLRDRWKQLRWLLAFSCGCACWQLWQHTALLLEVSLFIYSTLDWTNIILYRQC